MKDYQRTGQHFYEVSEVEDHDSSIQEAKFELLSLKSEENLCDLQSEGGCEGDTYYTDDAWAITHWCKKHWDGAVAKGYFKEINQ